MKKLAIIGASYLQEPLIEKAKNMGIETHVFAWAAGDVGERSADFFYPISIVEKDEILQKCREIGVDGICSIASDLAAITVNYVADALGLVGNTLESTRVSTNKHDMRECFRQNGDPSPESRMVESSDELQQVDLHYPVIVKPIDRSGSRGITKLYHREGLEQAIAHAKEQGFEKKALVEEFAEGQEYSVECISWKGEHHFLAMTKKYTTGAPHFIETAHLELAPVPEELLDRVKKVVFHALNSLMIENGASHTELKITDAGRIAIIEIGGRMGGDCIGSHLVEISTGVDFVRAVIQVALGEKPDLRQMKETSAAAVRFVFSEKDIEIYRRMQKEHPEYLCEADVKEITEEEVTDSSTRFGYYVFRAESAAALAPYLPQTEK
jgi:biotin carboxylase